MAFSVPMRFIFQIVLLSAAAIGLGACSIDNASGVPMTEHDHFSAADLDPEGAHEDEPLLRIGPITAPLND